MASTRWSEAMTETALDTDARTARRRSSSCARKNMRWGWALFGLFSCCSAAPSASPTSTSGSRRRNLDHRAACARRRAAARGEGSLRHGRRPHDVRLGRLRRPRPARDGDRRAACSKRRAGRTSARRTCTSSPTASTSQNLHYGTVPNPRAPGAPPAARAAARRRRSSRARPTRRSARTPAARSGSRPRAAASPGFKPSTGSCRSTESSRSPRASTMPARWRATSPGAPRCCESSSPGSTTEPLASLEEVTSASRGSTAATHSCASGSGGRRALPAPRRGRVSDRRAGRARVHARGRRRAPRALRDTRRALRREHRAARSSAAWRSPTASTRRRSGRGSSTPSAHTRRSPAATCC